VPDNPKNRPPSLLRDFTAGVVVLLVAIPLCLGIALASNAPLFSGLISGIVGGIVVGWLSKSQTSVSGPAAGLTAIVISQINELGAFETFLLAVVASGAIQIIFGLSKAGFIAAFFPTSVIKGMLAAIGAILILKEIPHLFGHDVDPEGDFSFWQRDSENTLSELLRIVNDYHIGSAVIGLLSLLVIAVWENWQPLKRLKIPAPLVVVVLGVGLAWYFQTVGGKWAIQTEHMVNIPILSDAKSWSEAFRFPDFSQWMNPKIYMAAVTLAIVGSLASLMNIDGIDKLDPQRRVTPPNEELVAQGVGNMVAGMLGGIPIASVVVRGSTNIDAGSESKRSAIIHGVLLVVFALLLPKVANLIPLSCLAAVLLATGFKLISPDIWQRMWREGSSQFYPFAMTVFAIVFTDMLIGIAIGMIMSVTFILASNFRRPLKKNIERHLSGDVIHIELANQVSFLNRAAIETALNEAPRGGHVLLDASNTVYIDPDVKSLIYEYRETKGPARGVQVSLRGFRDIKDDVQYVDYSTRELQESLTPGQVLEILRDGNARFRSGRRLTRDLTRALNATAGGQHPFAVVLSCIDSRNPTEYIFDLGLGDIFNIRIAGNIVSPGVLGSIEYACAVVGVKLILVMGHTRCGAVTAAVQLDGSPESIESATGCQHLDAVLENVQAAIPASSFVEKNASDETKQEWVDEIARRNVLHSVQSILNQSRTIKRLADENRVTVVGAMYDVSHGDVTFLDEADQRADALVAFQRPVEG
jgi:MFS superfamily sulfate permease-like transporter